MISLIICLVIALVVAAAIMGVVRALLATEPLKSLGAWGGVLYALVVLLLVLMVVQFCFPQYARFH